MLSAVFADTEMTNKIKPYIAAALMMAAASAPALGISEWAGKYTDDGKYTDGTRVRKFREENSQADAASRKMPDAAGTGGTAEEGGGSRIPARKEELKGKTDKAGFEAENFAAALAGRRVPVFLDYMERLSGGLAGSLDYTPSAAEFNLAFLFPLPSSKLEEGNLSEADLPGKEEENAGGRGNGKEKEAAAGTGSLYQKIQMGLCLLNPSHHQYSLGASLFELLNEKEQSWMYRIYHDVNKLPYRTSIHLRLLDGNGNETGSCTNTQEILSLASVYSYYHGWNNYEDVKEYALKLWELSHQFDLSVGDVYYCGGCETSDSAEETEELAVQEEKEAAVLEESEKAALEEGEELESGKDVLREGSGLSALAATPSSAALSEAESQTGEAGGREGGEGFQNPASGSGESLAENETPETEASQPEAVFYLSGSEGEPGADTRCPGHVDVSVTIRITDLNGTNNLFSLAESIPETEWGEGKAPEAFENAAGEQRETGEQTEAKAQWRAEAQQGTEPGASAPAYAASWTGWNEEARAAVQSLASQDWEEAYGMERSELSFGRTLTRKEYETYMALLPEGISPERRALVGYALNSVGKIPYYYGGKASRPGYEGNRFFTPAEPDPMGRTLKGMDCSGWINWVYWSVLGSPVTDGGTGSLAVSGKAVAREELKPGDIVVDSKDEAHTVMFLGWDAETGRMICIHESAGNTDNVTVTYSSREWTDYRRILND